MCWAIYACKSTAHAQDTICPNLTLLLERGALVTEASDLTEGSSGSPPGWFAVHFAARKLSVATLDMLLSHNATLTARTADQETVLHVAVAHTSGLDDSHVANMVKELILRGAGLDAINALGETALHLASKYHLKETMQCLLSAGCNPNIKHFSGMTPQQLYALDDETIQALEREALLQRKNSKQPKPQTAKRRIGGRLMVNGHSAHDESTTDDEGKDPVSDYSNWNIALLAHIACSLVGLGAMVYVRTTRPR